MKIVFNNEIRTNLKRKQDDFNNCRDQQIQEDDERQYQQLNTSSSFDPSMLQRNDGSMIQSPKYQRHYYQAALSHSATQQQQQHPLITPDRYYYHRSNNLHERLSSLRSPSSSFHDGKNNIVTPCAGERRNIDDRSIGTAATTQLYYDDHPHHQCNISNTQSYPPASGYYSHSYHHPTPSSNDYHSPVLYIGKDQEENPQTKLFIPPPPSPANTSTATKLNFPLSPNSCFQPIQKPTRISSASFRRKTSFTFSDCSWNEIKDVASVNAEDDDNSSFHSSFFDYEDEKLQVIEEQKQRQVDLVVHDIECRQGAEDEEDREVQALPLLNFQQAEQIIDFHFFQRSTPTNQTQVQEREEKVVDQEEDMDLKDAHLWQPIPIHNHPLSATASFQQESRSSSPTMPILPPSPPSQVTATAAEDTPIATSFHNLQEAFHAPQPTSNTQSNKPRTKTIVSISSSSHTSSSKSKTNIYNWTAQDDEALIILMKKRRGPVKDWDTIAKNHKCGKTGQECHERWTRYLKPGVRKGQWKPEEDSIVFQAVSSSNEQPFTKWSELAQKLPGRAGKQIRDRWVNYLNPALHHLPFTREDDFTLYRGHEELGKRWAEISVKYFFSTRSENQIKNRWYSASFKKFVLKEYGKDAYDLVSGNTSNISSAD